jgi:monovalent cation/hydrogen antiporter
VPTQIEVFVFLLFAVAVLAGLGLRLGVPYPVALVLGGLVIGLVPGLPSPQLDPDVVFFVFLPPLLYAAAVTTSGPELRANARPIAGLATGLVIATIAAVAAVANLALGIPWAAAFVLGAVLGPTDPVSAAAVLDRLGVTGRTKTILEGESLINDATGLTAYKLAIAAVGTGAGSALHVTASFAGIVAGGIAIGLVAGWVFARVRALVTDPSLDVTLSVLTPFVAYVPAEAAHVSGVLATVTAGVFISVRSLDILAPGTRLRTLAFWESTSFLLDGLLFLLIGVQVPQILQRIAGANALSLAGQALLVIAVVIAVRLVWMLLVPPLTNSPTTPPERVAIAWSGMRGGVSLAAALAIPLREHGHLFPDRDLVLFVAYTTIVFTLVVPGLTLAPLLKRLGLAESAARLRADAEARLRLTHAALERLEDLAASGDFPEHLVTRLRDRYESRLERLEQRVESGHEHDDHDTDVAVSARLLAAMIDAERDVLRELRAGRAFPAEVLQEVGHELDLDESRLHARIRL